MKYTHNAVDVIRSHSNWFNANNLCLMLTVYSVLQANVGWQLCRWTQSDDNASVMCHAQTVSS